MFLLDTFGQSSTRCFTLLLVFMLSQINRLLVKQIQIQIQANQKKKKSNSWHKNREKVFDDTSTTIVPRLLV